MDASFLRPIVCDNICLLLLISMIIYIFNFLSVLFQQFLSYLDLIFEYFYLRFLLINLNFAAIEDPRIQKYTYDSIFHVQSIIQYKYFFCLKKKTYNINMFYVLPNFLSLTQCKLIGYLQRVEI